MKNVRDTSTFKIFCAYCGEEGDEHDTSAKALREALILGRRVPGHNSPSLCPTHWAQLKAREITEVEVLAVGATRLSRM